MNPVGTYLYKIYVILYYIYLYKTKSYKKIITIVYKFK